MSAGAGRRAPLGRGQWKAWIEVGDKTARESLYGNDRTSLGDLGPREPESFSLPLSSCRLKANSAIPPLHPPPHLVQQLLAAQLPAAGAGEVVGGEGGGALLASRGWINWGSGFSCAL